MNRFEYRRRLRRDRRRRQLQHIAIGTGCVLLAGLCTTGAFLFLKKPINSSTEAPSSPLVI